MFGKIVLKNWAELTTGFYIIFLAKYLINLFYNLKLKMF